MNFKLALSYDGTDFHGWQRQPKKRTVQGELEDALARIAGGRVAVHGAGRTDAGVHALAQIASFRAELKLKPPEILKALNAVLPRDVRVLSASRVAEDFHARRSAQSKIYLYRIYRRPVLPPHLRRFVLHWPYPLDEAAMNQAAKLFVRRADFSAFSSNRLLHPVRRVVRSELKRRGPELVYAVGADGFLRSMVRAMVGTLLEVGRGRLEPCGLEALFRGKMRTLSSPTVPARGLWLARVAYSPPKPRPITRASSLGLK